MNYYRTSILPLAILVCSGAAVAQLPIPPSSQFDVTGFIQEATLGPGANGVNVGSGVGAHQGGTLKVNGQLIVVPSETIVILPANALTWAELFTQAPAPYGPLQTGLAMADMPAPLTTYEVHVVGNRVLGGSGGPDVYIAGLVSISQHALNSGAGFINFINYATGEMRVGGPIGSSTAGARVRINDPTGRYGRVNTPDQRFTVDPENPTISAATGFPMCLPRVDPASAVPDALCPQSQRPLVNGAFSTSFTMNPPAAAGGPPLTTRDPSVQAPFEVGDYVTFAGTLVTDAANPTQGPFPGTAGTYISAHTIEANVAIYTAAGTNPAYVKIDATIIGTGGLTVLGATEAVIRTRFEGMTTDVDPTGLNQRKIHLYGVDLTSGGVESDRDWGTIGVDPGPPNGAVAGRWRFRPPCLPFGSAAPLFGKQCVMNQSGSFLPPTREIRAVIEGGFTAPLSAASPRAANGIAYGQYHAPISEYIFPEPFPGAPLVENNFNTMPFLTQGGYSSSTGTIARQLNPWPSNALPAPLPPCNSSGLSVSAGGNYSVNVTGTLTLAGTVTGGTLPYVYAWTVSAGTLSDPTIPNPVFTAPAAAGTVTVTLRVTDACGNASSAGTTITVNAASAPTVTAAPTAVTLLSGQQANNILRLSGVDTGGLTTTFTVTQAGAPALTVLAVSSPNCPNPPVATTTRTCTATVTMTAPTLPIGQVTSASVTLTITAKNSANMPSTPITVPVTINPLPDNLTITSAEYRTGKQRVLVNVTSSVISPNVTLKLQPYVCAQPSSQCSGPGGTFDPTPLGNTFTNTGGGLYVIDVVGAPPPACGNPAGYTDPCTIPAITVKSNLNGTASSVLTRIRQ